EQARREAEEAERREREEAELKEREEAERKAQEEAERERREAEEKARREAEEQARREAEDAERREREEAERREREEVELKEREEAERKAKEEAERERGEAEEKARREAEEQARAQAPMAADASLEDLVKIDTDFDAVLGASGDAAPATATNAADDSEKSREETEAAALRQAEEQAAREADEEEKAREQAAAEAERAEEDRRRREDEARQRERAEDAVEQASDNEREGADAQALQAAQDAETERQFAEMEKELEAERAAEMSRKAPPESRRQARKREKEEARERKRAEAEAQAEAEAEAAESALEPIATAYRATVNWGRPVALGLFLILLLGLVLVHFIPFDASIPQFEKLAGAYLQQPVKIKALHLSLVPQPHWRLDGVAVGNEGQLTVARINAYPELSSLFGDQKVFSSVELESPVLGEEGLRSLFFGRPAGKDFKVASVVASNGKFDSKSFVVSAMNAKITLGEDDAWRKIALETPDHKTSLLLSAEGERAQIEIDTNAFSLPFHPSFILENFNAKGTLRRGELRLSELKGGIYGGYLYGTASLKWGAGWSLGGDFKVRAMDPARFAPELLQDGKLEGKAVYATRGRSYDELFAAPRMEGSFDIQKGVLLGVDLGRLLQGGEVGGKTRFAELTGSLVSEAGRTQLRQIHLRSGPVSARGSAEVDAGKRINGRFDAELRSPVTHARSRLTVFGTITDPRFSR
ncbi:MAG: hypothetical protein IH605_19685, partial [Burkholderiales bacterium]|nr:hypothetical protein [Burkholderiales bacterium]